MSLFSGTTGGPFERILKGGSAKLGGGYKAMEIIQHPAYKFAAAAALIILLIIAFFDTTFTKTGNMVFVIFSGLAIFAASLPYLYNPIMDDFNRWKRRVNGHKPIPLYASEITATIKDALESVSDNKNINIIWNPLTAQNMTNANTNRQDT